MDFTRRSANAVGGDRRPHHTFRGLLEEMAAPVVALEYERPDS